MTFASSPDHARRDVIVDGNAWAWVVYLEVDAGLLGGELVTYGRILRDHITLWRRLQLDVTVVFDGVAPSLKRARRLKRMAGRIGEIDRYLVSRFDLAVPTPRLPRTKVPNMVAVCRQTMLDEGVAVYDADAESDEIIAYLAEQRGAYILSSDTDFAFFDTPNSRGLLLHADLVYLDAQGEPVPLLEAHHCVAIRAAALTTEGLCDALCVERRDLAYLSYVTGNDRSWGSPDARGLAYALRLVADGRAKRETWPADRIAVAEAVYRLPSSIAPTSVCEWDRDLRTIAANATFVTSPLFEDPLEPSCVVNCTAGLRQWLYAILAASGELHSSTVVEYVQSARPKVTGTTVAVASLATLLPIDFALASVPFSALAEGDRFGILLAALSSPLPVSLDHLLAPALLAAHYLVHLHTSLMTPSHLPALLLSLHTTTPLPASPVDDPTLDEITLCAQLAHALEVVRWLAQALRLPAAWTRPLPWQGSAFVGWLRAPEAERDARMQALGLAMATSRS